MNSRYTLLISIFMLLVPPVLMAQSQSTGQWSCIQKSGQKATVVVSDLEPGFFTSLNLIEEAPYPDGEAARKRLQRLKAGYPRRKHSQTVEHRKRQQAPEPQVGRQFAGNRFNLGIPSDNDMSISDSGYIVSVTNRSIHMYDTSGQELDAVSLEQFAGPLDITGSKYDPRVIYDPEADRFVLCFLNGRHDTSSRIIFGFSQHQNPTAGWNLYSITGSPTGPGLWSDYPMIALGENALYFTINLIYNDSSWEGGFDQTVIWQIDPQDGYQGANQLTTRTVTSIAYNGVRLRNLCPVKGAFSKMSDRMYFLSNRNFSAGSDSIFLVAMTESFSGDASVDVQLLRSNTDYAAPPHAEQPGSLFLQTNDARVLEAMRYRDVIHFVGNTRDPNSGGAAVYHGVIEALSETPQISGRVLAHPYLDWGYPDLAAVGSEQQGWSGWMMLMNHAADTVFPGHSAMFYDAANDAYSEPVMLRRGVSRIDLQRGGVNRWGDYTGLAYFHSEGTVWGASSYGRVVQRSGNFFSAYGTWINELSADLNAIGLRERPQRSSAGARIYPNPAPKWAMLELDLPRTTHYQINLYGIDGRQAGSLYQGMARAGTHQLRFVTNHLTSGLYKVTVVSGDSKWTISKTLRVP